MKHGVFLVIALLIASSAGAFIPGVASGSPSVSLGLKGESPGCRMVPCNGCCNANTPAQAPVRTPPSFPNCCPERAATSCTSAAPAIVTNPLLNTIRLKFRGFRRISASNALDNPERLAIYELIMGCPGIDLTQIAQRLGTNIHTLRYHLDILTSCGKIIVMKDWGIFRYYENHGTYTEIERKVIPYTGNPVAGSILKIIRNLPGCTQVALSEEIGITGPTVRWYMQRFISDGIVVATRDGRFTRYELTSDAVSAIIHIEKLHIPCQQELEDSTSG
jgi:predicted transcriptional regulator